MGETVSVILPTYNRAYILKRAIMSVLEQTYSDIELIIVDDGSTDQTSQIVDQIRDDRIVYIQTKMNRGVAAARNEGLRHVTGEYIAFQDSDDYWRKVKLELQMQKMKEADVGFCYHKVQYDFGEQGMVILPPENIAAEKKSGDIYAQLLYDNLVDCPSLCVRTECMREIGFFDEELKALEDYDLALRLGCVFQAGFVDEVLVEKTYTPNSVSLQSINYLNASCSILAKYKRDYIATNTMNHRLERILEDSKALGLQDHYIQILECIMKL